jgi:hypothetical protein
VKHYVGRGLMRHFESGEALAKEMDIKPAILKVTCKHFLNSVKCTPC